MYRDTGHMIKDILALWNNVQQKLTIIQRDIVYEKN